jgi:hypothetical protein
MSQAQEGMIVVLSVRCYREEMEGDFREATLCVSWHAVRYRFSVQTG